MSDTCIKHRMPDGSIMDGPVHGPGQVCTKWSSGKQAGGYLVGPSHEEGGIPAIVGGNTPIELEGGEYIVNAQTVEALGQPFLDQLNSTQTTYHQGGYGAGQLPNPSQFAAGGRVDYNKKRLKAQRGGKQTNMATGGNVNPTRRKVPIQRKKLQEGGNASCPTGMIMQGGACFPITGNPSKTDGGYNNPYRTGGGIKKGGPKVTSKGMSKLKKARTVRKKVGGPVNRVTGITNNHSHTMMIDINGNGVTTGSDHIHKVSNFEVMLNCDRKCHTH